MSDVEVLLGGVMTSCSGKMLETPKAFSRLVNDRVV